MPWTITKAKNKRPNDHRTSSSEREREHYLLYHSVISFSDTT